MNSNDKKDESQELAPLHTKTSQKKPASVNPSKETLEILALVKSLIKNDAQKSKDIAELKLAIKDEQTKNSKAQDALKELFNATLKSAVKDIQKSNIEIINKKIDGLTADDGEFAKVFSSIEENMNTMNESIIQLYQNLDTSDLKSNVDTLSEQVGDMLESSSESYKIMSKFKDDAMKSLDKLAGASANMDEKILAKSEDLKGVLEQVNKATQSLGRTADDVVRRTNMQLSRNVDDAKTNIIELSNDLHQEIRDTGSTINESVRVNGVNVANRIGVLIADSTQSSQHLKASADKASEMVGELNISIEKTETLLQKVDVKKEEFDPLLKNSVKILKELTEIADGLALSLADDQSGGAK